MSNQLIHFNVTEAVLARAKPIRLVIFDVDGVLTDGSLYVGDGGEEYKAFYSRDGLGMALLQRTGVMIAIITGRTSQVVTHRMEELGISHIFQGHLDKFPVFEQLSNQLQLQPHQIAYVGDDVVDVPVMKAVGLAVAVGDAYPAILPYSHWQTHANGGRGAAREVCDLIMYTQTTLSQQLQRYGCHRA